MGISRKIYVGMVDDDEDFCRSMARLLRAAGMEPVTYPNAEDFLADARHPRFDCLILDIQLPGMSGLDLQRQLAATGSTTAGIFVTAHDGPEVREQAHVAGCAGYFRKTESGAGILEAIRRVVVAPLD